MRIARLKAASTAIALAARLMICSITTAVAGVSRNGSGGPPRVTGNLIASWRGARIRASRFGAVGAAVVTVAGLITVAGCAAGAACVSNVLAAPAAGGQLGSGAAFAGQPGQAAGAGPLRVGGPDAGGQAAGGVASAQRGSAGSIITLVTGDQVRADPAPGGGQAVTPLVTARTGAGTGSPVYVRFSAGGDQYVIPDSAVPYLGSVLDPRLFDVSYLARAGLDDAHTRTLPLDITYAGGAAAPALPGVHAASRSGATASAVISKAQAPQLGQMLARRWRPQAPGSPAAAAGGLPGIARISLASPAGGPALPPAPGQPSARPSGNGLHYRTLTLNFTGPDGKPATAIGWVQNVGDARLGTLVTPVTQSTPSVFGNGPITGTPGPVSVSVPDGTYSLTFVILTPHPGTLTGDDAALVVKPQVTIGSDQAFTLDARSAVPYRASLQGAASPPLRVDELNVWRISVTGGGCGGGGNPPGAGSGDETIGGQAAAQRLGLMSVSGDGFTASTLSATPTPAVTEGVLGFNAETMLFTGDSPSAPTSAPRYFLEFPHQGSIPSSLSYPVAVSAMASLHEKVYYPPPGIPLHCTNQLPGMPLAEEVWPFVFQPWGLWEELRTDAAGLPDTSFVPAGDSTEYLYSSDPKLTIWQSAFLGCDIGINYGAWRTISPGQQITESWGKGPIVPPPAAVPAGGLGSVSPGAASLPQVVVPASRQDNNAMLYLLQGGDSDPTHYSEFTGSPHSFNFYQDGKLAVVDPYNPGAGSLLWPPLGLDLPLLPRAATYRLDLISSQHNAEPDSHTVDTDWTFRSSPSDPPARLPGSAEVCAPDPSRACSFLPLLFITYDLPLDFHDQATAGAPFRIAFTVGHQQGETAPAGVSATVSASFDDGKTWTSPQPATGLGGGQFAATISQPPLAGTSGFVSLRVHAADRAGNSVDQTVIGAYGLTG